MFDGGRGGHKKGKPMEETPFLRFVFLTLPVSTEPVLNIAVGDGNHPTRYRVTRDQLYQLNSQIADALVRGRISPGPGQLSFELDSQGAA